jgi:hypothetical protein
VGFLLASIGFTTAVLTARLWESIAHEAHCVPTCPSLITEALRPHHFYYGAAILLVSLILLSKAETQRVRWDLALFLGIGIGLCADETGLLFLGVPYGSPLSLFVVVTAGGILFAGTINASLRDGVRELYVLAWSDRLTLLSILLVIAGMLYLDTPVVQVVRTAGEFSLGSAIVLLVLFGKKHFLKLVR